MPFVALLVFTFALGLVWKARAERKTYVPVFLIAAAVTIYFMR